MPLARVMGAVAAKALRPRAGAKRVRSSPISPRTPRTRAPSTVPMPGKLVMIGASGCCSNAAVSACSSRATLATAAIEGVQQRGGVLRHRGLDLRCLAQLVAVQRGMDLFHGGRDA